MVLLMQAGFCMVETGLTRAKNAVNIIMKNSLDLAAGGLMFFFFGFGIMFGTSPTGLFGTDGFFLAGMGGDPWNYAFFVFQAVFAATAATIVSGAVAERTAFKAYLIFSILITAIVYPVFGAWAWGSLLNGNGWLEGLGFIDFAGSTVVHSLGGWAALAGAIVVGPRVGKYDADGKPLGIPGHSLPLMALGVFILMFGWFGFNAGSTTTGDTSIALVSINTLLSACAGGIVAMWFSWLRYGYSNVVMMLNGILAGLVGITAGCANLTPMFAIVAGSVAGIIVVLSSDFFEKYVDDPVGAITVHGVCGVWGTLAAGIFDSTNPFSLSLIGVQVIGIAACFLWTFPVCFALFKVVNLITPLRVEDEEQIVGLDASEHGTTAYPDFHSDIFAEMHRSMQDQEGAPAAG